ncbi:MAG: hypothetical protein OXL96_08710 [Candidatus Poribacteria bacterium]|nr:hypothetical protein [Candidatus Poribacteria bacterium]
MHNTTVSNNTTDIKITPLLSTHRPHNVQSGHSRDGIEVIYRNNFKRQLLRTFIGSHARGNGGAISQLGILTSGIYAAATDDRRQSRHNLTGLRRTRRNTQAKTLDATCIMLQGGNLGYYTMFYTFYEILITPAAPNENNAKTIP